jgi:ATP-binding cassette subfamily B protein
MQLQNMFMMALRMMVRAPLLCAGGIFMSFMLSPRLALINCVVLPALIAVTVAVVKRTIPMFTNMQGSIDRINTVMRENLLGVRVVKAFTMEKKQFGRFTGVNDELVDVSVKAQSATFMMMPVTMLLMNLSVVAVLWFGGNMEISGALETGKIMALINYMIQITNSMVMVVNMIMNVSRAQASAARINEVFAAVPSISEPSNPETPDNFDIEFKNVSFSYGPGENALNDISFKIKHGQKVGIIGTTGCGKSTLVSLIPRLYDVSEGSVTVGGADVRNVPVDFLRKKIGVVLQESLLFSGSVKENMRYGDPGADDAEINKTAAVSEAEEFIARLPERLEAPVEQRGTNFSGGQKQRLSITRTLLKKPEILILDDATSAVDLATEAKMQASIREYSKNGTIILIAQRISAVMDCDLILVMDQGGRLSNAGDHKYLMKESELYRSIAVSQLGEEMTA